MGLLGPLKIKRNDKYQGLLQNEYVTQHLGGVESKGPDNKLVTDDVVT